MQTEHGEGGWSLVSLMSGASAGFWNPLLFGSLGCLMVDAKTFSWAVSWNSCRWPLHVAWASWQQGPSVSRASAYRERKEETEGALSGSYLTL